jgi:phytoene dehydrogenase-like protein
MDRDVVIVGGGLAGLCCARRLQEAGVPFLVLEADPCLGGRVRTDEFEGFLLDRGFQVLLTSYPEARRVLDYDSLNLQPFVPGALVRFAGRFHRVADPWRQPSSTWATLRAPIGTWRDKLRMARLRARVCRGSLDDLTLQPDVSTQQALESEGFSDQMIERFFRPFFAGVLLERELDTSRRLFDFLFRMFSTGDASVPARGMQEIVAQLARTLPESSLRCSTRVDAVVESDVQLHGGETLRARAVVIATEAPEAHRLGALSSLPVSRSVDCLYFAADEPPLREPILILNGEGRGPVNNVSVMSTVAPTYAPEGKSLVSVSAVASQEKDTLRLERSVREQLTGWFGDAVERWQVLRRYHVRHALPATAPGATALPAQVRPGLYACGDHRENASIHGAMLSGRRAADAVIRYL